MLLIRERLKLIKERGKPRILFGNAGIGTGASTAGAFLQFVAPTLIVSWHIASDKGFLGAKPRLSVFSLVATLGTGAEASATHTEGLVTAW